MSEIHVNPDMVGAVGEDSVRRSIDLFVHFADVLAGITPTGVDDQVVAFVKKLSREQWFIDAVVKLLNKGATLADALVGAMPEPALYGAVSTETIRGTIQSVLDLASYVVPLTPTPYDDQTLAVVKQFATQDWFVNLLAKLFGAPEASRPAMAAGV